MTDALIIWIFMLLMQQDGMQGGMAKTKVDCEVGQVKAIAEARALGQQILAVSECQAVTLKPVKEG